MVREADAHADERRGLRLMRFVSLLEGTTLATLVFVAVPLKHIAGYPIATAIMGPIHGGAFLFYVWMLARTAAGSEWPRREIVRLFVVALIPFGAFTNERFLRRKEAALAA